MTYSINTQERRRSQRISQSVPVFVRHALYSGNLRTTEVSNHGCVIHAIRPFPRGTELRLEVLPSHSTTTAHVVHSNPVGSGMRLTTWTVALELDQPGNIWMVEPPPPDWWPKTSEQKRSRERPPLDSNRDTNKERRS